jgi:membrane-bound serine protease (ClpP class)
MAFSALPVSYAGLALLALGVALMIAETVAPGFGVLGIGGMIAFALGAVFLFDPKGADIDFSVAWPLVLSATLTSALILIGLLGLVVRARRSKIVAGSEEMIGLHGEVMRWSGQKGRVLVHGELWSARSPADLSPGCKVSVERRDGLTLVVSPIEERT